MKHMKLFNSKKGRFSEKTFKRQKALKDQIACCL